MADNQDRKTVYLSFHKSFVREGIPYVDRNTGEERTFNSIRLPDGTNIGGRDMGGWEFSPFYVNPSKYQGDDWRDVPMLADREVWLTKSTEVDGQWVKDTVKVMPQQVKEALDESRRQWAAEHGLQGRAEQARQASDAQDRGSEAPRSQEAAR